LSALNVSFINFSLPIWLGFSIFQLISEFEKLVLIELSNQDLSIALLVSASALHHVVDPHAFIGVSLTVANAVPVHLSKALSLIIDPESLVGVPVHIDEFAVAVLLIVLHVSLIHFTIFPGVNHKDRSLDLSIVASNLLWVEELFGWKLNVFKIFSLSILFPD